MNRRCSLIVLVNGDGVDVWPGVDVFSECDTEPVKLTFLGHYRVYNVLFSCTDQL